MSDDDDEAGRSGQVRARIELMVQDPEMARERHAAPITEPQILSDEFFLDGPVSRRVAIVDFDPDDGHVLSGARWVAPRAGTRTGTYEVGDPDSESFRQVNVFGTVHKTLAMFERPGVLGRKITWGFGSPQLLVVPRAGVDSNAYYERESRSLQFFHFPDTSGATIYTAMSRDVVAHETGHAILDGIAPSLYDCLSPQAIALHETIADMTALVMAVESRKLRTWLLKQTKNRIDTPNALAQIAEQFGRALDSRTTSLRNMLTERTLDDVISNEPHELSEILSASIYRVFIKMFEDAKQPGLRAGAAKRSPEQALGLAVERLKRIFFRALDFMPPGEIGFVDYARAVVAADAAAYPREGTDRAAFVHELVKRKIATARQLAIPRRPKFPGIDVAALLHSDLAAYRFADRHRSELSIPDDADFEVVKRLATDHDRFNDDGSKEQMHEMMFKVQWLVDEAGGVSIDGETDRAIMRGTTIVFDAGSGAVRSCLTNAVHPAAHEAVARADRDSMLRRLLDEGLRLSDVGDPPGVPGPRAHRGRDGSVRVLGAASALHLASWGR